MKKKVSFGPSSASVLQDPFFPLQLAATWPSFSLFSPHLVLRNRLSAHSSARLPQPLVSEPRGSSRKFPAWISASAHRAVSQTYLPSWTSLKHILGGALGQSFTTWHQTCFSKVSFNTPNFSRNNIIFRLLSSVFPVSLLVFAEHTLMILEPQSVFFLYFKWSNIPNNEQIFSKISTTDKMHIIWVYSTTHIILHRQWLWFYFFL